MPRRPQDEDEAIAAADEEMELADEDRLPWLEAVEEDEEGDGPSIAKLVAAIVIGLVAIGVIVGGVFWLGNRGGPAGNDSDLIAAEEGDYKVRPDHPGGMNVSGEGDAAYQASAGNQPQGQVNANAVSEVPLRPGQQNAQQGQQKAGTPPHPAQQPPRPAPQQPAPAPASGPGGTIQLGAFSSQAGANRAWQGLAGRFRYLAPLGHSVVPATVGGRTVYRLRASGPGAADVCRRLRIAGEDCSVVG
ncbi:MAG TPA: SPOR domain-containing protein [Allosphingosinicella sp.]|nr:SPOR domain-containing protein [Allosphingosinicella sp.]